MCRWILLWISLTSLVVAIPEEHQYCAVRYRRLCQGKGRHIACQFPDAGPGPSCERYTEIKFTNEIKHFITHYLNRRRQRIAAGNERVRGGVHLPKPQVMMLVEWDRELSRLAQRLADQCHFVHDDCRATVRYPYAGQTVGEVRWRRSSESDELSAQRAIRRVLDAWWGERRRVQPKQLTAPFRLTAKYDFVHYLDRGTVWGHFSQLAVWNLQAVGCGAVRHGAQHPRLLLVCDFSHTNMLGQRTLVSGAMVPCPIHTARRPRTAYPLLCAPVRRPLPAEPEVELEDNYEDSEEPEDIGEEEVTTVEGGDVFSQPWRSVNNKWKGNTKIKTRIKNIEDFPEETRKMITIPRGLQSTLALNNLVVQKLELEQTPQNEEQKMLVNHHKAIAHNSFANKHFENVARDEWRTRKKQNYGQWRKHQENQDNLEEVIPLSVPRGVPRSEVTESFESRVVEKYRPEFGEEMPPRTAKELYRPTVVVVEDITDQDDSNVRPRWRQTRIRPQRPGANALLARPTLTLTDKLNKKEFIASLNLDREDIDQIFRDTGFNVNWRNRKT